MFGACYDQIVRGLQMLAIGQGYGQDYLDLLFKSIVPSQLTNGLSINDACEAGLVIIAYLIF